MQTYPPLLSSTQFSNRLLKWHRQHGRFDLPWQQNITPYKVWVSEIMLQQTQVTTVIPYFNRFMHTFPSVAHLAAADEDIVLSHWAGLGYYARARNLHRSAKIIVQTFAGQFPDTLPDLVSLPGIGPSTAGAILSLGFGLRGVILDGNVKRVLARMHKVQGWPGQTQTLKTLWKLAEYYTPENDSATYTQAIMDLGATLCTPKNPDCERCPFAKQCLAYQDQVQHLFPETKKPKALPLKQTQMLIFLHDDFVLLTKRPAKGIWGSLWSFPECEIELDAKSFSQENYGLTCIEQERLASFKHTFSHYHLEIFPQRFKVEEKLHIDHHHWYPLQNSLEQAIPRPVSYLLEQLQEGQHDENGVL